MENKSSIRPFGWQDRLGYAMGDMGCGFSFQLVSTFMQLFYLQYIGIKAADYAVIILITKPRHPKRDAFHCFSGR